jgi:hypothetical protein
MTMTVAVSLTADSTCIEVPVALQRAMLNRRSLSRPGCVACRPLFDATWPVSDCEVCCTTLVPRWDRPSDRPSQLCGRCGLALGAFTNVLIQSVTDEVVSATHRKNVIAWCCCCCCCFCCCCHVRCCGCHSCGCGHGCCYDFCCCCCGGGCGGGCVDGSSGCCLVVVCLANTAGRRKVYISATRLCKKIAVLSALITYYASGRVSNNTFPI